MDRTDVSPAVSSSVSALISASVALALCIALSTGCGGSRAHGTSPLAAASAYGYRSFDVAPSSFLEIWTINARGDIGGVCGDCFGGGNHGVRIHAGVPSAFDIPMPGSNS